MTGRWTLEGSNEEEFHLPGAVVMRNFDAAQERKTLLQRVNEKGNVVGYGVPAKARMEFDGRKFRAMGEQSITICLPTSKHRNGNFDQLAPGKWEDHIAMVRAAIERKVKVGYPPPKPKAPFVEKGTLILIGGGATPKRALRKFIEVAGGKESDIIVIPTAQGDRPDKNKYKGIVEVLRELGAGKVSVKHAKTAAEADTEDFANRIRESTGIFFTGGRQWRLVDKYFGTRTHDAIRAVLAKGGVVGGSSAGATICGGYLVRGNPLGPRQMMAEGYERGLDLLSGTAIDQHFTQRSRSRDMEALKKRFPQLLGIGLDEATAIIVGKDRVRVVGRGTVFLYEPPGKDGKPTPAKRLQDEEVYFLGSRKMAEKPAPSPFD